MGSFTELGAPTGEGLADWDVEAFLEGLQAKGTLESLRKGQAKVLASKNPVPPQNVVTSSAGGTAPTADLSLENVDRPSECTDLPPQFLGHVPQSCSNDDTSASEAEDWDRWTSTEDEASTTTCTESDIGSERDLESQPAQMKPAATRSGWGFQRLVRGGAKAGKVGSLSDSCESLPYLDGDGNIPSMINSDSTDSLPGCRGTDDGVIEDSELDDFLGELEQNEKTSAAASGWKLVMHKNTKAMLCCSWLRVSGVRGGTEYRGRMVVQGVSAETARDFFLDEQHRAEWDENRLVSQQLEDWDENGCTAIRWVRRLPFFLKSREYVVSRRVWNPEYRTFYCISRHTSHTSAPLRNDVVRVSSFHSSWRIRPVKPGCPEGTPILNPAEDCLTGPQAVEIITHHEEESGLQKDLARMGVAHGMWSHIQKMEVELHAYAASGKNAKHILPVFLIQADARLGLLGMPLPLAKQQQEQLERHLAEPQKHVDKSINSPEQEVFFSPITPPLTADHLTAVHSPLQLHEPSQ